MKKMALTVINFTIIAMSAEEIYWPFEDEIMEDIFERLGIKKVSWKTVREYAEDYKNQYKDDVLRDSITMDAIEEFDKVFYYGDNNITDERAQAKLIDFIRKHKEFYNDDPVIIYNRIAETLEAENKKRRERNPNWTDIPYINWLPGYGGLIRSNRPRAEQKFHEKHNGYFLANNH